MARPQKNTVEYFPHLLSDGKKMFFIESRYGNDGYATWFKILEKLATSENHYLNLNTEEEVLYLASKCFIDESRLILIINDLVKVNVFDAELWQNKIIWCPVFIDSIRDAYKKRNNKCINLEGLRILLTSLGILKPIKGILKVPDNTQSKVKYSKEDKSKEDKSTYSKDLLNDFFKYWTEPNKSNTKFRQELEKTWDLERRLETWAKNDRGYKKEKPNAIEATLTAYEQAKHNLGIHE